MHPLNNNSVKAIIVSDLRKVSLNKRVIKVSKIDEFFNSIKYSLEVLSRYS